MKKINNFRKDQGWFLDKDNKTGPLTMSFRRGSDVSGPKHKHKSTYEYFIVLSGHATLEINGDDTLISRNSVTIVEPNEIHLLKNASDDFSAIFIMDKYVENDKVSLN